MKKFFKMTFLKKCQAFTHISSRTLQTKVSTINGQKVRIRSKDPWISTIGLEVHAQLLTKTKLFSRALAAYGGPVNSQVSLLDASTPGTLPVINKKAVELALKAALAMNCQINQVSTFDRKHYFYADLPAGYQITQQRRPLAVKGHLDFTVLKSSTVPETYTSRADIIQIQLEQDSGKSLHDEEQNFTLVDLNRCGTGLIEIVFGPDLFHGEDAASLIKELCLILKKLEVCSCQMELGALRVDANISVRPFDSEQLGTRTEVKNINSVRGIVNAIEHEIDRQIELLEKGGIVINETRNYDGNIKRSVPMRDKEVKQDYRFMPEPNLPPLRLAYSNVNNSNILNINDITLVELPEETRKKTMVNYGLDLELAVRLVNEPELLELFEQAQRFQPKDNVILAHLILLDLVHICTMHHKEPTINCVPPEFLAKSCNMKINKELSQNLIIKALECAVLGEKYDSLEELLEAKGWLRIFRNDQIIDEFIQDTFTEKPKVLKKYRKKQDVKSLNEMVKHIMSKNEILDPVYVKNRLIKKLKLLQ